MLKAGSKIYNLLVFLVFATSALMNTGCYKISGNQTIPAYISIDDFNLNTYYPEQGSSSSEITDVWVYLNDDLLGIYEFPDNRPMIFPVLAEGKNKLEIRPGIKLNGISSTRVPYPFYKPVIFEDFDFIPGTTQSLGTLTTEYYAGTKFAWLEDFEQANISLSDFGDTITERTQPENNPAAFLTANSRYSGEITLTNERDQYGSTSFNAFEVQKAGTYTMLEMNFKIDNFLQVGVVIFDDVYDVVEKDLVILNHTDEWKKIYINLGSNLSLYPTYESYKVIFRAGLEEENSSGKIFIDNIKVVYR